MNIVTLDCLTRLGKPFTLVGFNFDLSLKTALPWGEQRTWN